MKESYSSLRFAERILHTRSKQINEIAWLFIEWNMLSLLYKPFKVMEVQLFSVPSWTNYSKTAQSYPIVAVPQYRSSSDHSQRGDSSRPKFPADQNVADKKMIECNWTVSLRDAEQQTEVSKSAIQSHSRHILSVFRKKCKWSVKSKIKIGKLGYKSLNIVFQHLRVMLNI